MTPNNTLDLDSLRRFIQALTPAIHDLLHMSTRLQGAPDAIGTEHATRLRHTAELLHTLHSEFSALIALTSPEHRLQQQGVNMQGLCQAATDLLGAQARQQGIRIEVQAPPDLIAWADPALCAQVLRRLLANALRFNRDGGRIIVAAKAARSGGIVLRVADSGRGIDPRQCEAVFAPFERLGKELCATDGTGMGLAMARHMATRMSTELTVRSRLGRGSIFRLILPRAYPQASQGH